MQKNEWAAWFVEATNSDPFIASHGRNFTCKYMLDMGSVSAIVEMVDGRAHRINTDPGPMDSYDFAFRACAATWRDMSRALPEPGCQGVFAASATRDMKIEGDIPVLMRNLGNVTRQVELLRNAGVPV